MHIAKSGGIWFWKLGSLGGSFYVKQPKGWWGRRFYKHASIWTAVVFEATFVFCLKHL